MIKERPGGEVYNLYANSDTRRPVIYVARAAQPAPQGAGGTSQLALNTWTHLAATYDGTTLRLYRERDAGGTRAVAGPLADLDGVACGWAGTACGASSSRGGLTRCGSTIGR